MSLLDTQRELARPIEEVARAISEDLARSFPARLYQGWEDLTPQARATMRSRAAAALTRITELGFINDIGLEAIKAEAAGERK